MDFRQRLRRAGVHRARRGRRWRRRTRSDPRAQLQRVSADRARLRPLPDDAHRRAGRAAADESGDEVPTHRAAVARVARRARRGHSARRLRRACGGARAHLARHRSRRDRRNGARAQARIAGPSRGDLAAIDRRQERISNRDIEDSHADRKDRKHSHAERSRGTCGGDGSISKPQPCAPPTAQVPRLDARDDERSNSMQSLTLGSPEAEAALRELESRRSESNERALRVADETIAGVRAQGDAYVAAQITKFDGVTIAPNDIKIIPGELPVDPEIAAAIDTAIARVGSFHLDQLPKSYRWTSADTEVLHRVRPLRRVGIYVPGGRAVYVSTLIMGAVPARIAGVPDIIVATTAAAAERPELQYACRKLGIREIYRAGGASAIAAMALGTESIERVDKVVGPGNQYVPAAKARLIGEVGIDMTAGPTEPVVVADETSDPELVAADLAAQAEHGPDSAVVCVLLGDAKVPAVPEKQSLVLRARSIDDAIAVVNRIAPEHLSLITREPLRIAE